MENGQVIKAFIASAKEYSIQKTEITMSSLQRLLQILSATTDLSIFDPGNCTATEFYVCLHELMAGQDASSEIIWCAVSVLQEVTRNSSARTALIHTYKFTPILTKLLSANLNPEKRYRLLKLLEELTYNIQITWQEGHLPHLIRSLIKCIESKELLSVALGVLVNICYKNSPAIYTLMQCVDIKSFTKTILTSYGNNVENRVLICKLLLIVDHLSGEIPEAEFVMLVKVTLAMMTEAVKSNNINLLQHIVDFFKDMKYNVNTKHIVISYSEYCTNTESLIALLSEESNENKEEVTALFIEFLQFLLLIESTDMYSLYPRIVRFACQLVQTDAVSAKALELLRTVAVQSRQFSPETYDIIIPIFEQYLQIILLKLNSSFEGQWSKKVLTMTALFNLLQELAYSNKLYPLITASVEEDAVLKLCEFLSATEENVFQQSAASLYVQILSFVSELSSKNEEWLHIFSNLLNKNQILQALAIALYVCPEQVKLQVLFLFGASNFPNNSFVGLAKCLSDLSQLFVFAPLNTSATVPIAKHMTAHEAMPITTLAKRQTIDMFINKLEERFAKKEDIPTSSIMELYEYKLSVMNHSEKALQANLNSATAYSTQLTHRLAQLSSELNRLYQLLFANQKILEGEKLELCKVKTKLQESECVAKITHKKYNQLKQEMQTKSRSISELLNSNKTFEQKTEELEKKCCEQEKQIRLLEQQVKGLESKVEATQSELEDKKKLCQKLEKDMSKQEQIIVQKESEIDKQIVINQGLSKENAKSTALIKGLERSLHDKEKELIEADKKISELQKVRDMMREVLSTGKY